MNLCKLLLVICVCFVLKVFHISFSYMLFMHIRCIMDIEELQRQKMKRLGFIVISGYTTWAIAATHYYKNIYKESCMTSLQTGESWMMEILNGHYARSKNNFRMEKELFIELCNDLELKYGLERSRVSTIEKVGIFVYALAKGASNRDLGERFQRSGETISRSFHEVLEIITGRINGFKSFARDMIKPTDHTFQSIPSHILHDERYMPYFKDFIGCIDGTHIVACVPEADQMRYRGRKTFTSFNVMAACDFDMCFTFISAGWEGSAHDSRIFLHAINTPSLNFPKPPEGKYYLVDKGYPDRRGYLVPYFKTRYHQNQFENVGPNNAKEVFNRAHSSLRSCIERSFGVLKKRWKILNVMPQFSVQTQIDIIIAAFALHNYIRKNAQDDDLFNIVAQHPDYVPLDELSDVIDDDINHESYRETYQEMKNIRNNIASQLWMMH
ncbi:hypothetical protein Syun_015127 [Stephania yunnanensis]|uniref:DDE Tnp4 domain-containing protein n=1 Tax=Stephania yunnanensis TaxID=152371 RepID=A0AAP0JMX0_9MAGN